MGFVEESPEQVRSNIELQGKLLRSKVNGKTYEHGSLLTPSLGELRQSIPDLSSNLGSLKLSEAVGDVQHFHRDPQNAGALFQAASQFNLLEMASPSLTPEAGVGIYQHDCTQGPACAIACGAGTIYRNYFVELPDGQIGQTADQQVDCLQDIGIALGNPELQLWNMQNGYAFPSRKGLTSIEKTLQEMSEEAFEGLKEKLRIGIQSDTQVTLKGCSHTLSQAYCSALPVTYTRLPEFMWTSFARLVLEATYEATLISGYLNYKKTGNPKVFLTLVGGGVFGNRIEWILAALEKALEPFQHTPLEVIIVSYGRSHSGVQKMIRARS